MGCCLGRDRGSVSSDEIEDGLTVVKNKPLVFERIKWKSDVTMTYGQLRSKRDEFWDTAPAFDGRKEIWDALRAALNHAEQGDLVLAQAILDGANISMPDGE
uniref:DC-UbP/UBTD2 N-terminal domain-containing protein n=1 Tax=Romanomermis culicivorax TaxID=13658 RepID=A0A915J3A2_ROMCU